MSRLLVILAVLAAAGLLPACGNDDDEPSADAQALLAEAFDAPVESGKLTLSADVAVDGIQALRDGIQIEVGGPFTRTTGDFDVTVGGIGPGVSGGFTVTEDNMYVSFAGRSYELGEEFVEELTGDVEEQTGQDAESLSLEALGVDAESWLRDARIDGEEEVAGEPVTKVVAELDAATVVADVLEFAQATRGDAGAPPEELERFPDMVEDSQVEVYVAESDSTIRRVALELEFEVPEDAREQFGGAEGGSASFDVTFADIGEPQRIEPPEDPRPFSDLLRQFGLGAELLLQ